MAEGVERPIIFPLSNPTSRAEATPEDLVRWTNARVIVGTGSPFPPVKWKDRLIPVDQTNNSYIFPGLGLGVLAANARRITDAMFMAAAKALAELSPAKTGGRLLPPVSELRAVALAVATAVARQAQIDGVAPATASEGLAERIRAQMWEPVYHPYRRPQ
jgi:malate dehydrogenase (oxaloacetate-decarboxylating)